MKNSKPKLLPINEEHVLVCAFRYALARQTPVTAIVIAELKKNWPKLRNWTQKQIREEIYDELNSGEYLRFGGFDESPSPWKAIYELPVHPQNNEIGYY